MTRIGNYEIIRLIGEGGFGKTYEGRHILNNNIKACLKQNRRISEKDSDLLMREASIMAQVHHYSLPAFRDLIRADDGSYVLIMSFIEGKTLDKIIEKHKALHPEEVSWISSRLLGALYYLHKKGIVHGDIKPSNVIVQPSEHNAVLIDYGLSVFTPCSSSKATGYTEIFSAPEITQGNPPLRHSDIYSLGLTMIYAMGGDPIAKSYPDYVPKPLQEFCNSLTRQNPLDRTSWDKEDLGARLSDIRYEVFGRRHSH